MDILRRARPVNQVLADPGASDRLRNRLRLADQARRFAAQSLALPAGGSYRRYVELERPAVVWNVTATPAFSIHPREWCYPIAGCFDYRGYFSKTAAEHAAKTLAAQGLDVCVSPATAYSTLGWFDDPLLSTMLRRSEAEFIGTLFHELAHRKLHIRGDTPFNEAFAVTVAEEGVRRWYEGTGDYTRYLAKQRRRSQITSLLLATRRRLDDLYRSPVTAEQKQLRKQELFDELRRNYEGLKASWEGYDGFDDWFPAAVNNAHLALAATYHDLVPGLRALLQESGDMARFYEAANRLAALPRAERHARLRAFLTE